MASEQEFMTVAEIAAILKLNQQTIRNWIDAGRLAAHRLGRRVRDGQTSTGWSEPVRRQGRPSPSSSGQASGTA
jgi:excisionase family DNA binding protein